MRASLGSLSNQGDSDKRAVLRCHQLAPEIVKLVTEIREKEGFLSLAQIRGGTQRTKNRHNDLMHDLAKAQRASGLMGGRESRPSGKQIALHFLHCFLERSRVL